VIEPPTDEELRQEEELRGEFNPNSSILAKEKDLSSMHVTARAGLTSVKTHKDKKGDDGNDMARPRSSNDSVSDFMNTSSKLGNDDFQKGNSLRSIERSVDAQEGEDFGEIEGF
jgi:hypothetical protein